MTREEILKDQWVIDHYGDFYHPDYLNPDFEAGVDYGEEKTIEKACEWLINIDFDDFHFRDCDETFNNDLFIDAFRKAMKE